MNLPPGAEEALAQFRLDEEDVGVIPSQAPGWPPWAFPTLMFVLTVLSTVWVGIAGWSPVPVLTQAFLENSAHLVRRCVLANWQVGLQFSGGLLAILLAHEFGHYGMMRYYGVRSTHPIFIPFPFSPFGTFGALIMMDPSGADRRQIFDIGLAGPLAGLVVAVPLAIVGLLWPEGPPFPQPESLQIGQPLVMLWLEQLLGLESVGGVTGITVNTSSPLFMAAWIGFLITGLNMVPIGQLDGGHVAFGLFGPAASWVAKGTFAAAITYVALTRMYPFLLMLILIFLLGLKHPPSRDDSRTLGLPRTILGLVSLSLPILCIPATPLYF